MNIKEILEKNAYTTPSELENDSMNYIYRTKIGDGYLARVGMEEELDFLAVMGITEQLQPRVIGKSVEIGFNPVEQKWYGWSNRAIYGFGIGSVCRKGMCHYTPSTPEELYESYKHHNAEFEILDDGIKIKYDRNERIIKCGKGEWECETLEDAKQMAMDFAESVS